MRATNPVPTGPSTPRPAVSAPLPSSSPMAPPRPAVVGHERWPCASGTRREHGGEHRQRGQGRGDAGREAAQPAMRGDAPRPGQHGQPRQRARQPEALQQQIRQHRAHRPGEVRHHAAAGGVQRRVARVIRRQRDQQGESHQPQRQPAQLGEAAAGQRAQRGRGKSASLGRRPCGVFRSSRIRVTRPSGRRFDIAYKWHTLNRKPLSAIRPRPLTQPSPPVGEGPG